MKIEQLPSQLTQALPVLQKLNQAGYEAYFVGGCVRDTILQRPLHDVDLATSAYPQEIKHIFKQTIDTGIEHGTVTVLYHHQAYEITTFRTESGYQDYRRPDSVQFVRSLKDDLQRRDFTINALAMDYQGKIIDLFEGLADLADCRIRAVGKAEERFHEDALRMLRAVRFQAQLDFTIESQTLVGIKHNAYLLQHIAVERIREEFIKLMQGQNRQAGLKSLIQTQLYQYCPNLNNYPFARVLEFNSGKIDSEAGVWAFLGYLGDFQSTFFKKFLHNWKIANHTSKLVQIAVNLLQTYNGDNWDLYLAQKSAVQLAQQVLLWTDQPQRAQDMYIQYNGLPLKSVQQLAINGQDLIKTFNYHPGPLIGQILTEVQKAVVAGDIQNDFAAITKFINER